MPLLVLQCFFIVPMRRAKEYVRSQSNTSMLIVVTIMVAVMFCPCSNSYYQPDKHLWKTPYPREYCFKYFFEFIHFFAPNKIFTIFHFNSLIVVLILGFIIARTCTSNSIAMCVINIISCSITCNC